MVVTTFAGFGGMTEPEFKQIYSYLFAPAGATATTGVLSGLAVAQTTTASGSVTIAVGAGVVQDALVSGATPVVNNASVTLDVFTANPMSGVSNPRNDIVVFNPLTESIQTVVGTPNAAPTDPTVATTSLKLARLRHAANATTIPTAKIDDLRVFTGVQGYQTDTGWKNISITGSGFSTPSGNQPWQVRQIGAGTTGVVYFRGALANSTYADTLTVATLPAGITLPVTVHALALTVNATARSAAWVNTSGGVALYASAATTAFYTISGSYPTG
jgi:hypothetical protein